MTRAPGSWTRPPPAHPSQSSTRSTRTFLLSGGRTTRISRCQRVKPFAFLTKMQCSKYKLGHFCSLSPPPAHPSQSSIRLTRTFSLSGGQTTRISCCQRVKPLAYLTKMQCFLNKPGEFCSLSPLLLHCDH